MRHDSPSRSRTPRSLRLARYRPSLETLERRLPLGDALLGTLLGSAWIASELEPSPSDFDDAVPERRHHLSLTASVVQEPAGEHAAGFVPLAEVSPASPRTLVSPLPADGRTIPPWDGMSSSLPDWAVRALSAPARQLSSGALQGGTLHHAHLNVAGPFENTGGHAQLSLSAPPAKLAAPPRSSEAAPFAAVTSSDTAPSAKTASPATEATVRQNYGRLPISFEANVGQADSAVQFLAHGSGYGLYLTGTEAVVVLNQGSGVRGQGSEVLTESPPSRDPLDASRPGSPVLTPDPSSLTPATVVRMQVLGGNAAPAVVGRDPLPGKVNYLLGNDPTKWHINVPTFAKVEYQNVYPGIDLVYYGRQGHLEYDFVVAPGADPQVIHLGFSGADQVTLDGQGNLVLHAEGRHIVQHKPVVYQEVNGTRQEIASAFVLEGQQVRFDVAAYDAARPLVIDPVLSYSTYLGGESFDGGGSIAVDAAGSAYVTGITDATSLFPTANAFVTKLSADGASHVYSTYLGGSDDDSGQGIAVDAAGNAYVTGHTFSTNFPTANAFQPTFGGGSFDGFVTKLAADGASLVYSTYLGGSNHEGGSGIAVDAAGNAYVTGYTNSTNFPTANAFQPTNAGLSDAFVTKFAADGASLVYSTYLGGSGFDLGRGIAVDADGNVYVAGPTSSTNFPTFNAFQPTYGGGSSDAFVTRFAADGASLLYSTYLGGSSVDEDRRIAVDGSGNAYVTGTTRSTNFPTANPVQPTFGGGEYDAFVTEVAADGGSLVYSTYLGGSANDFGHGIAVDGSGNAYVTGLTQSTNFPTFNAFQPTFGGGFSDAFVTKFAAEGTALVYSSYLGGGNDDGGNGIAVDASGNAYVTGVTSSTNFPTTPGAFDTTFGTDGLGNPDLDEYGNPIPGTEKSDALVTKIEG